jgi:hypothetical protein
MVPAALYSRRLFFLLYDQGSTPHLSSDEVDAPEHADEKE